jgi:hypothetical protein
MRESSGPGSRKQEHLVLLALALFLLGWFIYDKGFPVGLHLFASLAYFLSLFCLTIAFVMGALFRHFFLSKIDYLYLVIVAIYLPTSIVFSWPALLFLSLLAPVCGVIVGTISYFASPYRR